MPGFPRARCLVQLRDHQAIQHGLAMWPSHGPQQWLSRADASARTLWPTALPSAGSMARSLRGSRCCEHRRTGRQRHSNSLGANSRSLARTDTAARGRNRSPWRGLNRATSGHGSHRRTLVGTLRWPALASDHRDRRRACAGTSETTIRNTSQRRGISDAAPLRCVV